jgi:hydroxymethylbilane synthase
MKLKMGTRGSALALAQSGMTARALEAACPGLTVETVVIKTSGDVASIQGTPAGKGLFVKEIEEALLDGRVDFAVHSAKDLPAEIPPGLTMAAYPKREDPRDAFLGNGFKLDGLKAGHRVATTSLRRSVQLAAARPGLSFVPMRGNVDTRLRKMGEGACDALILAAAGLKRLGRPELATDLIDPELIVPAPAQGALAMECRQDRADVFETVAKLDHAATRLEVELERAFMKVMGGGCTVPLGALGRAKGQAVHLSIFWSQPDGSRAVKLAETCPDPSQNDAFARDLAARAKK